MRHLSAMLVSALPGDSAAKAASRRGSTTQFALSCTAGPPAPVNTQMAAVILLKAAPHWRLAWLALLGLRAPREEHACKHSPHEAGAAHPQIRRLMADC